MVQELMWHCKENTFFSIPADNSISKYSEAININNDKMYGLLINHLKSQFMPDKKDVDIMYINNDL